MIRDKIPFNEKTLANDTEQNSVLTRKLQQMIRDKIQFNEKKLANDTEQNPV
jgi:hypothetical protein